MFSHERVELIKSLMTSTSVAIENSKLTRHIIDLKAQNFAAKEVSVNTSAPKYNIDAPLKKTIDMLSKMRAAVKKDDKSITQLDFVLKMLTSSDLFAASIDDINDEQGRGIDQDTKSWIENSLLEKDTRRINNHRSDSSSSITITQEFDIESPTESSSVFKGSIQDPLLINSAQIIKILDSSSTQNFNVLELAEATGGRPLYYLSIHILEKYGIVRHFGLNEGKMRRFLENIESSYHNLPYHNSSHAADVLYTVNMMLFSDSKVGSHFSKIEVFAACIASSVHDVDHPGLNNNFLVQTGQRVAILYNDTSVLEFHHCSKTFQIASEENANIFSSLTNDQYRDCRKLVLSMVLATDMSQHFQYVNKLKGKIAASSLKMEDSADRNLVLDMAIKCADLNNPSKPTDQSIQWAYRVMREFFAQGDLEQKVGIPVSKFYDRENTNIPRW